jgi:hypothetical protein
MTALAGDRATTKRQGKDLSVPVAAATLIYAGSIACLNAAGTATKGATSTTLKALGVAINRADNTNGAAGDINVNVERGVWRMANSAAGDQITLADYGASCYIVDDQTVAKTNGGTTRSVAGVIRDVDASGVWVEF